VPRSGAGWELFGVYQLYQFISFINVPAGVPGFLSSSGMNRGSHPDPIYRTAHRRHKRENPKRWRPEEGRRSDQQGDGGQVGEKVGVAHRNLPQAAHCDSWHQ